MINKRRRNLNYFQSWINRSLMSFSLLGLGTNAQAYIQPLSELLKANPVCVPDDFKIQEYKLFEFVEDPKVLSELNVQMSIVLLSPEEYKRNLYQNYDIDGFFQYVDEYE